MAKNVILMAMLLTIIILLGYLPPITFIFSPVPIVMQNLGIMLLGGLLGWRYGGITVSVFLLLAALGFPVLSGGRGGIILFVAPTGGYLIGYFFAVIVIGWLIEKYIQNLTYIKVVIIVTIGATLINLTGSLFISYYLKLERIETMLLLSIPFMIVDMLKVFLASSIIYRLRFVSLIAKNKT